jgi:hypothetical protein
MKRQNTHPVAEFLLALGAVALWITSSSAYGGMPMSVRSFGGQTVGHTISLGSLTVTGVYPRIFSPNGDGFNDKVGFHFDNPEDLPVSGTIYNLSGCRIADLTGSSDPNSLMVWDGKDSGGRAAPAGIYLYKIEFQGKSATGTVVLAR